MATYKVGAGYGTDMSSLDFSILFHGTPTVATKKMYVLEFADGLIDFRGRGFKYGKDGVPKDGTVEGYAIYDIMGQQVVSFGGYDVSVKSFVKAASTISTNDDAKLLAQMLSGNDKILGGELADGLMGFKGKDILYGGGGADVLMGGKGADRFVFTSLNDSVIDAADTIIDFKQGQKDKIDLSQMGTFSFEGEGDFGGEAGELVFFRDQGNTVVAADQDGDGQADFVLLLNGEINLTETDFIL